MRRIGEFTLLFVACIGLTGCGANFKEFSPDPKFKVLMPGDPKEQSQDVMGLQLKMWMYEVKAGGYAVTLTDMGVLAGAADVKMMMDGARDGAVSKVNGKLLGERSSPLPTSTPAAKSTSSCPTTRGSSASASTWSAPACTR
jgi:hypothetical protein